MAAIENISKIAKLPPLQSRAAASILGAVVADAAARPLHWVYDREKLDQILKEREDEPEFWPESKSPFYTLPTGARSCYNHVLMTGLEAFTESGGKPDLAVYKRVIEKNFGAGTDWQVSLKNRREAYSPEKRKEWTGPVEGPWLHGSVIHLLEKGEADADNIEMDSILLCLPHLVFRVEQDNVMEECLSISSLLAGQTDYVRCQATILRQLLLKGSFGEGDTQMLEEKARELAKKVFDSVDDPHIETVKKFGMACSLPGSLQGSLHAFLKHSESAERYKGTIRDIIRAGGCNCSRANYAGATLGAVSGVGSVPKDWIGKVSGVEKITDMILSAAQKA